MRKPEQLQYEPNQQSSEPLLNPLQLEQISREWNIPKEDILLIAMNASGIKCGDTTNDRGRFIATFPSGRKYLLALTVSDKPFSAFEHDGSNVTFNGRAIAIASPMMKDTCTDSYWRGGKRHLTLNSNSRSNCRGCAFCGTYSLENDDKALTTPDALRRKAEILQLESGKSLSELESVAIVTGCFPSEESWLTIS